MLGSISALALMSTVVRALAHGNHAVVHGRVSALALSQPLGTQLRME